MNGFSKDKLLTKNAKKARCLDMCTSFPLLSQMNSTLIPAFACLLCVSFCKEILEILQDLVGGKETSDIIRKKNW